MTWHICFRGLRAYMYWHCPFSCANRIYRPSWFYHWSSIIGIAYWKQLCQICRHLESLHQPRSLWVLARYFYFNEFKSDAFISKIKTILKNPRWRPHEFIIILITPPHLCRGPKIVWWSDGMRNKYIKNVNVLGVSVACSRIFEI